MKTWLAGLGMMLILSACGNGGVLEGLNTITSAELETKVEKGLDENVQYVDVRETEEFSAGAVPGFENIPMDIVMNDPSVIDEDRDVVLLCNTQNRSAEVANSLIDAGYDEDRIIVVEGGISDYASETN